MQSEACREILKEMKHCEINTAVDTCGFVAHEAIDSVMPYTDTFLYDIKAIDVDVHKRCTGQPNGLILDNLMYIDKSGAKTEIRIPYVPGYNDNQIDKIGKFLSNLKNITGVRVLPYHNYAASKYAALGIEDTLPKTLPSDEEISKAKDILKNYGIPVK